jgi:hypothetical protein
MPSYTVGLPRDHVPIMAQIAGEMVAKKGTTFFLSREVEAAYTSD